MPKAGTARRIVVTILIMTVGGNVSSDCEMADGEPLVLAVEGSSVLINL
jgi:hypothetical protein